MIILVESGQTLMDLAIQYYGNASAVVELAADNGLAITDELEPGETLNIREDKPATAIALFADYLNESGIVIVSKQSENTSSVLVTDEDEIITDNDDNGLEDA